MDTHRSVVGSEPRWEAGIPATAPLTSGLLQDRQYEGDNTLEEAARSPSPRPGRGSALSHQAHVVPAATAYSPTTSIVTRIQD